ncbi:MAG: diguanylate cyclase [Fusobacteriaceae bacterium]|nr:diguanylate cyclase [Fusobacteriaceae bacterium]MBP6467112.1 diguanylate cyclase [Fusobacteriaceae bacterium]MBU9917025.1 diguanylate cyclase [Fusobacteriaceae bacterium]
MNLKKRFLIFIILMILVPLGIISISSYYYRTNFYVKTEKEHVKNHIILINSNLDSFGKEVESLLKYLVAEYNDKDEESFRASIKNLIVAKKEFMLVYYGLENTGEFYGVSQDLIVNNKNPELVHTLPSGYNPRVRPWYVGAKEKRGFFLSEVYTDVVTKKSIVTFSIPIYKADKFIGVMALDIDLKELSKRLNLHRFVRGSLCVIDHNGHVIISSDEKELGTTNKYFNKIVGVSGEFVEKSEESIYIYQLIDQMDFYILAQVSKENILKEFKPLRQLAVIIGIISIVFSIIIISTTIKIIEKFLSKVTKTLDNVSEGKYENNIKDYENLMGRNKEFYAIKNSLEKMQNRVQKREMDLEKLANYDMLTMIYNRRYLFQILNDEYEKAKILDINFTIALLDLDDFKLVNDTFGHCIGDDVLKKIVLVIKENLREKDIVGRYGGEEFLIIFPDSYLGEVIDILRNIRQRIEDIEWEISNLKSTVSIGAVDYRGQSLEKMIQEADYYLYEAKHEGKNKIESPRHSQKNNL